MCPKTLPQTEVFKSHKMLHCLSFTTCVIESKSLEQKISLRVLDMSFVIASTNRHREPVRDLITLLMLTR